MLLADVDDDQQLQMLAECLRLAGCSHPISVGGSTHLAVAVSVGAARATTHQRRPEGLLARADVALYAAKETGRNRTAVAAAADRRVGAVGFEPT